METIDMAYIIEDILLPVHWESFRTFLNDGIQVRTGILLFTLEEGTPRMLAVLEAPNRPPPDLLVDAAEPLLEKYGADFYMVFGETPMALARIPDDVDADPVQRKAFLKRVAQSTCAEEVPEAQVITAVVLFGGGLAKGFMAWGVTEEYIPGKARTLSRAHTNNKKSTFSVASPDKIDNLPN